jgi:hypothetical protein
MKKFYLTMVAMLCGVAAMAQTNEIYVSSNTNLEAGTTATTLVISMKNDAAITAVSFKLQLPEGVKAKAVRNWSWNEDRIDMDKVMEALDDEEAVSGDVYKLERMAAGNDYMYNFYPNPSRYQKGGNWIAVTFTGNDGELIYAPLTIDGDGEYELKFYDISLANDEATAQSVATSSEFTCKLNVGGTGINSINAADSKAPVYNLAGQRVSKAQKGVFIQNGKKVAVK